MNSIANTPLLKLERIVEPGCADIFVKYEATNPTMSMKDRMALSMIEGAERRGRNYDLRINNSLSAVGRQSHDRRS